MEKHNLFYLYYTLTALQLYRIVLQSGKNEFWASDFGFEGGQIQSLLRFDLIEHTGETKDVLIPIEYQFVNGRFEVTRNLVVQANKWRVRKLSQNDRRLLREDLINLYSVTKDCLDLV